MPPFSYLRRFLFRAALTVGFSTLAWNSVAQHYYLPAGTQSERGHVPGRWLSPEAVRDVIEDDIALQSGRVADLGREFKQAGAAYQAGLISRDEFEDAAATWREEMYEAVKNAHLNYAAAARGGFHNMTAEHYGRVGGLLRFHIEKLDGFTQEILENPDLLQNGIPGKMNFEARSQMYISTALFTYERERVASNRAAGYDLYENIQHSQESCTTHLNKIGCTEISNKRMHPVGTSPDIGKRACGPADLCTWAFGKSNGITQQAMMSAVSGGTARTEGRLMLGDVKINQ